MQRHWDGAVDEMDKRFRELSSVAMLARRDIDRYIWLSERRPDLAALAPVPPGLQQKVVETKLLRKNKKCADGANASSRRAHSRRGLDEMARSSGRELSDLLRFFSTLDMDLQKLLLEAITKHKCMKTTKKKDMVQKEVRKRVNENCSSIDHHQANEDDSPCSFREWTHFSSREDEKFTTEESSSSRAQWPSNSLCRLTNASCRPRGGCGTEDEGVCRDVAIQTQRILPIASKAIRKGRDRSCEAVESVDTAGKLLADHSAQTSSREELTGADDSEDDIVKYPEETTLNILERWAEPLEQYLTTLEKFEQELREKWLNPKEIEMTPRSEAQTGDLESLCTHRTYETSETQRQRISPDEEGETRPDTPVLTRKLELTHAGGQPLLENSIQENFVRHKNQPELRDPNKDLHRARTVTSGALLHSKGKPEYLAAGFRARKLAEWWPTDKPLHTSVYSGYDPRKLLCKREQNPAQKQSKKKPEWWPALRRPYSASDIEFMRQKEDTTKITRRKSPSKIFCGYRSRHPPGNLSNKSPRRKTQELLTCGKIEHDDLTKRAVEKQISPPSSPPRMSHEIAKAFDQKKKGPVGEFVQMKVKNSKTGHGGLHALQEYRNSGIYRTSNRVQEQVFGMITHLEHQVCGVMTQLQAEQELEVDSHQQIKTPREADSEAGVLPRESSLTRPVTVIRSEQHDIEKKRNKRIHPNLRVQRGVERLADKLIDQAVNEVASELAEFCESVADQMYTAEFVT